MAIRIVLLAILIMAIILILMNPMFIIASIVPQISSSSSTSSSLPQSSISTIQLQQQQSPLSLSLIDHVRPRDLDEIMSKYGSYLQRSRLVTSSSSSSTTSSPSSTTTTTTTVSLNPTISTILQNRLVQTPLTNQQQLQPQQQQDPQLYNGYSQQQQQQQRFNRDNIGRSGMAVVGNNNNNNGGSGGVNGGSTVFVQDTGKIELSIHHDQDQDILNTSLDNQNIHYGIQDESLQMNDQQQLHLPSSSSSSESSTVNRRQESIKNPTISSSPSSQLVAGQSPSSSSSSSSSPASSTSESSTVINNNNNNNNHLNTATISDMFISIDGRLQKLQDQMIYHRSMNNYGLSSPSSTFPSYLNMMKTQFLSMENLVESKLSTIENKFSNIVIEDEIWKKTINWKVEEILSKISQSENKVTFSNEQIINKLDLIERNFKVITNDLFSKFLLVNEKLNMIELNIQNKLNDFETKIRKTFDYQHKLVDLFKQDYNNNNNNNNHGSSTSESSSGSNTNNNNNNNQPQVTTSQQPRFNRNNNNNGDDNYLSKNLPITSSTDTLNDSGQQQQQQQESFENGLNWTNQQQQEKFEFDKIYMETTNEQQQQLQQPVDKIHESDHRTMDLSSSSSSSEQSIITNNGRSSITRDELIAQCEPIFQRWKQNKFKSDDAHQLIICKQLLTSLENGDFIRNDDQQYGHNYHSQQQQQQQYSYRDRLEKRNSQQQDLDPESIMMMANDKQQQQQTKIRTKETIENNKMDDIINLPNGNNNDHNGHHNKKLTLEELDSKLQYFATKIIKIVQEMWHSSQTSQQYLFETLNVANETKEIIREEFKRLNNYVKPLNLLAGMTDDIRDPIMTRLKEMSTAINNSVAVILNTQSQYMMRQDDQAYKILTISVGELRNHSTIVSRKVQEQGVQINQKFDQIYKGLNQIGRKTIETVGHQLLDIVKKEMHTIKSILSERSKISVNELDLDSPKSLSQNQCKNDCFISRQEIDNLCYNIESKPYHFRSESPILQPSLTITTTQRESTTATMGNVSGQNDHFEHIDHHVHGKNLTNIVEINNGGNNGNDNDDNQQNMESNQNSQSLPLSASGSSSSQSSPSSSSSSMDSSSSTLSIDEQTRRKFKRAIEIYFNRYENQTLESNKRKL
ncbi:uncharacterized protein LOC113790161 isoform X1 [Dermatophagoides pteronyssinus]|uniref:uncharacterized protein LOC113790161 isoform X1 n=1 Tax=Dermatophagoides pteronyssinus TaxID=6956 RepID=UPI003F668AF1